MNYLTQENEYTEPNYMINIIFILLIIIAITRNKYIIAFVIGGFIGIYAIKIIVSIYNYIIKI